MWLGTILGKGKCSVKVTHTLQPHDFPNCWTHITVDEFGFSTSTSMAWMRRKEAWKWTFSYINLCCIHPWNTIQNYKAYMKNILKNVNCIFGTITQIFNSQLPGLIKETHTPPAAGLLPLFPLRYFTRKSTLQWHVPSEWVAAPSILFLSILFILLFYLPHHLAWRQVDKEEWTLLSKGSIICFTSLSQGHHHPAYVGHKAGIQKSLLNKHMD